MPMSAIPTIDEYRSRLPHPARTQGGLRKRRASSSSGSTAPLVTIITSVHNGCAALEQTIKSVIAQTYPHIEYIVIDGASTDGTLDVIQKYDRSIDHWISEPDEGISDAFNKGISLASGEFIGLLNADDWMTRDQVEQGVKVLQDGGADFVFGDVLFYDAPGTEPYRIKGDPNYRASIRSKMPELCHPTVLVRRSVYERTGLFDPKLRYAMDYEWLLRLHTHGGSGSYVPLIIGHMRGGGASDRSFVRALREVREISIRHGHPVLTAHILFGYRIIKGSSRRALERLLPHGLFDPLRTLFNPRYIANRRSRSRSGHQSADK